MEKPVVVLPAEAPRLWTATPMKNSMFARREKSEIMLFLIVTA